MDGDGDDDLDGFLLGGDDRSSLHLHGDPSWRYCGPKAATRAILLFAALSFYVGRTQNIRIFSDRCPLLHCYKHGT